MADASCLKQSVLTMIDTQEAVLIVYLVERIGSIDEVIDWLSIRSQVDRML